MPSDREKGTGKTPADDFALAQTAPPTIKTELASDSNFCDTEVANTPHPVELARTQAPDSAGDVTLPELPLIARSRYIVEKEIARGGMGRILAARDKNLGRPVAIKELIRANSSTRARFEQEARITARLQHPAIVPLYEAGRWPDGEPFFAMKMVSGSALDAIVEACKTPEERIALLPRIIDVADALAYAHSQGIIHRDLKPANVLLGDYGETVVIDWGLAKRVDASDDVEESIGDTIDTGDDAGLTVLGEAMGTPAYMPPEQARGENVDKQADVYALGAMLYHVLGGKMAYADSSTAQEVLEKVLNGPPTPLSGPDLPAALIAIVNKAMAREKDARYSDASEFADELRRFEAGKLVAAHRYTARELIGRWARKHRGLVISTSIMFCLLVGFGVWSLQQLREQRDQAMEAKEQAILSRESAMEQRKEAVTKSLQLALTSIASIAVDAPLESLAELADLDGLEDYPELTQQARMIAAQARSQRIARELTAAGTRRVQLAMATGQRTVAIAWKKKGVALIDLDTGSVRPLPTPGLTEAPITGIRFSPNGKLLGASSNRSEFFFVWDFETESPPTKIFTGNFVRDFQFSPDGRWLAVVGRGRLKLYDLSLFPEISEREVSVPLVSISEIAFSPDGKTLALAAERAALLDLETATVTNYIDGMPKSRILIGLEAFGSVRFSPRGDSVVFADKRVFVIHPKTGVVRKLFETTGKVTALAYSSDGKTVAAGGADTNVYLQHLDLEKPKLDTLSGHGADIQWLAFADGDKNLLSSDSLGKLVHWHLGWSNYFLWNDEPEILSYRIGNLPPRLSDDESIVAAFGKHGELLTWKRKSSDLKPLGDSLPFARSIFAITTSSMAWTRGSHDTAVHLRSAQGPDRVLGEHGEQIEVLAISPEARFIVSGGKNMLHLWDTKTGLRRELKGHKTVMRHAAFVADTLVTVDFFGEIFQWDLQTGEGRRVSEHGDRIASFVATHVDPKGKWVVTLGTDNKIILHNLADGKQRVLHDGEFPVGIGASPNGDLIAFSTEPSIMLLINTRHEAKPIILRSPQDFELLQTPSFSPDSAMLVASNANGLRLWTDLNNSQTSKLLRGRGEPSLPRFSPDGSRIVACESDPNGGSVWHVASGQRRAIPTALRCGFSEFWPEDESIVVGTWGGQVQLWQDELPKTWPALRLWIADQVKHHRLNSAGLAK